ncbi:MAG: pyridoxal phosphate-dependent aminotransferase [Candidatus Dactylopiibacterium sp.]|nr:pyridoxal phosphate-dependent aminotransferase [Candidatus Dactylopiibacterium sp.]
MDIQSSLADRVREIPPFHVMELLARAHALQAEGRDIIHLEVGEPDFGTPPPVVAAAQRFLMAGSVRYTPALGLPALREAIAAHYADRLGARVDPARIVVTAGASGALLLAIATLTNPGQEWLLTDPGYPCNRQFVQAFNGVARLLPVGAETHYQPSLAQLREAWTPAARGVLVASPANPTGTLLDATLGDGMAALMRELGGQLIVDEIYQGLVYDEAASTILARHDDVFVVNSFSKYFGMTGWRLGWLVVPEGYAKAVERLAQHLYIAPSTVAQHAALAALQPDCIAILEARRQTLAQRRHTLARGLETLGFGLDAAPQGAFYIYARTSGIAPDSMVLAHRLLEHAGVACTPGADFGDWRAREHMRFAYTADEARLEEALQRIRQSL